MCIRDRSLSESQAIYHQRPSEKGNGFLEETYPSTWFDWQTLFQQKSGNGVLLISPVQPVLEFGDLSQLLRLNQTAMRCQKLRGQALGVCWVPARDPQIKEMDTT
eukprot:6378821-Amphidinium_carterae.1